MSFFSIIIPCYNSATYLVNCIESVLQQDFQDFEIILINDNSTDSSGDICDDYSNRHKNIKLFHQAQNGGVSISRNRGIKAAQGKYTIFLDSDDYLAKNSLGKIAALLEQKPTTDVLIGNFQIVPDISPECCYQNLFNRKGIVNNESDDIISCVKSFNNFTRICWCYIINLKFLRKNKLNFLDQVRIFEDTEFVTRMLCISQRFVFFDEPFYKHRRRPGSLGQSIGPKHGLSGIAVVISMCKLLNSNNQFSAQKREFIYGAIKDVLNVFIWCIFMLTRKEMYELTTLIKKDIKSIRSLEKISKGFDLYYFLKTFGAYKGLFLYKSYITEKIIQLNLNPCENPEFYIFCAGIHAEGIARILIKEGLKFKGYIDNNTRLQGSVIFGFKVESPSIFASISKVNLPKCSVIICNQSKINIEQITLQLQKYGLKEYQIASCNILDIFHDNLT